MIHESLKISTESFLSVLHDDEIIIIIIVIIRDICGYGEL